MSTQFMTLDVIDATFRPRKTDDLRPGVAEWIGKRTLWQCIGMANPESEYAEQAAFNLAPSITIEAYQRGEFIYFPATWIPECDLEVHEIWEGPLHHEEIVEEAL